jgi:hypothetical protein
MCLLVESGGCRGLFRPIPADSVPAPSVPTVTAALSVPSETEVNLKFAGKHLY